MSSDVSLVNCSTIILPSITAALAITVAAARRELETTPAWAGPGMP